MLFHIISLLGLQIKKEVSGEGKSPDISFQSISSSGVGLFFLFRMLLAVAVRCFTYILIESGIERLTIGKTYHRTDFLHILVGIPLVLQQMHSFFHTIFVQKTGIIHSETRIDYSRQVTGIGFQLFGQIFGRIVTISVLFLHNNDIKDLVIQFVSQLWTDLCAISRIFFFFLTQIIGAFFRSLFLRFVF